MIVGPATDARIEAILELILRLGNGELGARGELTDARDELDGIVSGLNMLADELAGERAERMRVEALLRDEVAARIHATPIPDALRPEDSPTWFDRVLRRTRRATERVQDLVMRLVRDRPPHAPETLIHGDFTLDNVIVDGDEISGVIDWGGAGPGDPRYDVTLALSPDGDTALEPGAAAAFLGGYCAGPISKQLRRFVEQTYGVRAVG